MKLALRKPYKEKMILLFNFITILILIFHFSHYNWLVLTWILFGIIGGLGMQNLSYETNNEKLFIPVNAKGLKERSEVNYLSGGGEC